MEKLTITRIGAEKTIDYTDKKTGKPSSFKKVGVQTNEYGDRWFDVSFRQEVPVKVGQSYDFEITSREYNGKTYYEAKLPRDTHRPSGGGMSSEQYQVMMRLLEAINTNVLRVWAEVDPTKGFTSDGKPVPDFTPATMNEVKVITREAPEVPEFTDDDFPQF